MAIPMFGKALGSLAILVIYSVASNPDIFARLRNEVIGLIVLFRRSESQAVSEEERVEADRIMGRFKGQSTFPGAYPSVGESGTPRFLARAGVIIAYSSAEASLATAILAMSKS
jgi:hypothetical protein